jgi:hypothetical protein
LLILKRRQIGLVSRLATSHQQLILTPLERADRQLTLLLLLERRIWMLGKILEVFIGILIDAW